VFLRWLSGAGAARGSIRVSGQTDSASTPSLGCSDERCAVAWSDMREGVPEIYGAVIDVGGSEASSPVRLSASNQRVSGGGGAYSPSLATDGGGRFLAAWHDSRSRGDSEIYAMGWRPGLLGSGDHRISAAAAPSTHPAAASCAETTVVAWRDRRRGAPSVMVACLDRGGRRISAAAPVDEAGREASSPSVACAGSRVAVAWTESVGAAGAALRVVLVDCE
jgi:hypothetical protein